MLKSNDTLARDRISQVYLGLINDPDSQERAIARVNWIIDQVESSTALDVGCSEGIVPILLGRKGIDVTGIDINKEALDFANNLLSKEESIVQKRVRFICGNILLAQELEKFDHLILGEIIEHFSDPTTIVTKALTYLRPHGKLIVTTPFGFFPDPDHQVTFTLSDFVRLFKTMELTPTNLFVKDGYIHFVSIKEKDEVHKWVEIENSLLEMTEQATILGQKAFHKRSERFRNQQRTLSEEFNKLKQQFNKLEGEFNKLKKENEILYNKYILLKTSHQMIVDSSWFQIIKVTRKAFGNLRLQSFLLPIEYVKILTRWFKKKKISLRFKNKIVKLFGIKSESQKNLALYLRQETTFLNSLQNFISKANIENQKPVIIISTGTKRMGKLKRVNRTMAFAKELSALKYPVIYIYYRWRFSDDYDSDYDGEYLLQLPNDIFHKHTSQIAGQFMSAKKLFLVSIPDINAVPELNLFRAHNWKIGYEVRDEWSEFHKAGVGNWYDPLYEVYLCNNADFVTTVSNRLQQKMLSMGANSNHLFVVPNGVNNDFIEKTKSIFEEREKGYRGNGTIGYFGHLTEKWFNWDLVIDTAKKNPRLNFEIIGFDAPKNLHCPKNIRLLGEKTHDEIIQIARNWSLSIIPFKNNELSRAVDPIKLYEYLALGLVCVSCQMDQIIDYPFTFIYKKDEDFITVIDEALKYTPTKQEWKDLRSFTEKTSWRERLIKTLEISQILDEHKTNRENVQ